MESNPLHPHLTNLLTSTAHGVMRNRATDTAITLFSKRRVRLYFLVYRVTSLLKARSSFRHHGRRLASLLA